MCGEEETDRKFILVFSRLEEKAADKEDGRSKSRNFCNFAVLPQ